ncbi:MAG: TM2 domain-containing protein [Clostridiales bacterium]|nr:TM2 domain-containing protein [Clostridiales bacterium]
MVTATELKDPTTLLLISIFLGSLGVDRFMLGDTGMGILKLLTGGVCGILTIIDWFTVQNKTKELNFNRVMQLM